MKAYCWHCCCLFVVCGGGIWDMGFGICVFVDTLFSFFLCDVSLLQVDGAEACEYEIRSLTNLT